MQNQTQKLTIQWFLDFINVDLNRLDLGEKMKLIGDALTIYYGFGPWLFSKREVVNLLPWQSFDEKDGSMMLPDPWGDKSALEEAVGDWLKEDKLTKCHKRLKTVFSNLMQNYRATLNEIVKQRQPYFESAVSLSMGQENFKNLSIHLGIPLEEPISKVDEFAEEDLIGETELDEVEFADVDTDAIELKDVRTRFHIETLKNTALILSLKSSTEEETLLLYFCIALQGTSLSLFTECPECGNWFIHTSKKKRIFCSAKCAMRKANRDRRKSIKDHDPDEYKKELTEGRKRAKKSYRKRTKK
jgi:endogenous inhibitor of DNA gyrase (YacG/DUF329 family)